MTVLFQKADIQEKVGIAKVEVVEKVHTEDGEREEGGE